MRSGGQGAEAGDRQGGATDEVRLGVRYPGESEAPSPEEAQAALAMAREVYDAVLARLPEQVRP